MTEEPEVTAAGSKLFESFEYKGLKQFNERVI